MQARPDWRSRSDRETFAAAALPGNIGVPELQPFVQPLAGVIDDRAVQIDQALGINKDRDTIRFEGRILRLRLVDKFEHVSQTRAP